MDLKRLRYYCTIYEMGSISRAAAALHMSQPPLGQRLHELEKELGVSLIVRDGRRWQITEAGRLLYERARQLLAQADSLSDEVRRVVHGTRGTVYIGASSTCFSRLQRCLTTLLSDSPTLHFKLMIAESTRLENLIKQRELDFAVVLLPLGDDVFNVDLLPPGNFSAIFGKGLSPPEGDAHLTVKDLEGVPLICHRRWDGHGLTEQLIVQFQQADIYPNIVLESPDVRSMFTFIASGVPAVALVPTTEIPELFHEKFAVRTLDLPSLTIQPAVIRMRGRYLTGAAQYVLDQLLKD